MTGRAKFAVLFLLPLGMLFAQEKDQKGIIGYIPNGSISRISPKIFEYVSDAIYFGIEVDTAGNLDFENVDADLGKLQSMIKGHPVKLKVCFGGWDRSDFFIPLAASPIRRDRFCKQTLLLCKRYNLQGVDIDWEFPKKKSQKENFTLLIKELYQHLNPEGIEISLAVGFWKKQALLTALVEPYISSVNLMLYDNFSPFRGHASYSLVKRTCKRFLRKGIPATKLIVGVPFYGRHRWRWKKTMEYSSVPGHAVNIKKTGVYKGFFFDVPSTLNPKIDFIRTQKLGGIMIWELGGDAPINTNVSLLKFISHRMSEPE